MERGEPLPHSLIGNTLIAWIHVGQAAHIARTLDVILAPERIESRKFLFHMAGEHRQLLEGPKSLRCRHAGLLRHRR